MESSYFRIRIGLFAGPFDLGSLWHGSLSWKRGTASDSTMSSFFTSRAYMQKITNWPVTTTFCIIVVAHLSPLESHPKTTLDILIFVGTWVGVMPELPIWLGTEMSCVSVCVAIRARHSGMTSKCKTKQISVLDGPVNFYIIILQHSCCSSRKGTVILVEHTSSEFVCHFH